MMKQLMCDSSATKKWIQNSTAMVCNKKAAMTVAQHRVGSILALKTSNWPNFQKYRKSPQLLQNDMRVLKTGSKNNIIDRSFSGCVAAKEWDSLTQSKQKQKDQGTYYRAGQPQWPLQNSNAFLLGFVLKQAWLYCMCNRNPSREEELEEEKRTSSLVSGGMGRRASLETGTI